MTTKTGPLAGVRILELAGIGPGPYACMLLAQLGADVLRVDRPGGVGLKLGDDRTDLLAAGRPTVVVDVRSDAGRALIMKLAATADALVEGNRPGVMERLGIGPAELLAVNPRLVYGRMTGWGQTGPRALEAGHDLTYLALTGALLGGSPTAGPPFPANLLGDFAGGSMFLVTGLLAGIIHARATGQGQVVDAAIVDGAAHLTTMLHGMAAGGLWTDGRGSNLLDGGSPFYATYACAGGGYVALGALEPQFWAAAVLGLETELGPLDLPDRNDRGAWPALRRALTDAFQCRSRDRWAEVFAGTDACVTPVLGLTEAVTDAHLQARGVWTDQAGVNQPAPAPRFSATPAQTRSAFSTSEALTGAWGLSADEAAALV